MKKLLCLLGFLSPFLCAAQQHDAEIMSVSNHTENNVHYVENTDLTETSTTFTAENYGGFYISNPQINPGEFKRYSDKFWVWVSFGITSLGIIGLLLVFNKLKKSFNSAY